MYKYKPMVKCSNMSAKEQKQITFIVVSVIINILLISGLFISYQAYDDSSNRLASKIDKLYKDNKKLETLNTALFTKLEAYEANEAYLQSIGATKDQARITIKAARIHHVDPKF